MDEQRAIELCVKHRDPVGFEFLVQQHRREAFFHAFTLLGNQDDAMDACQDAFARAFNSITQVRALPRFYPWFYCILRNHCLNLLARRQTSDRYRTAQQTDPARGIDTGNPAGLLEAHEEKQQVHRAMDALSAEHREILAMKYIQGHRYDEIAAILDIPRGTVMSRLYHARLALREAYLQLDRANTRSTWEKTT
ncbi:MAG TPA: sigma-70 family RNA polymerase sigma factor [Verrucomicrobiota bacterium]|nr:sigma-70 family RNA polymerase sigma factor [Verrucomicrobiota bacterium]